MRFQTTVVVAIICVAAVVSAHDHSTVNTGKESWSQDYTLILLQSGDISSTHAAQKYVESLGGRIAIVIPPKLMLGWVPPAVRNSLTGNHGIQFVSHQQVDLNAAGIADQETAAGVRFFNYVVSGSMEEDRERGLQQETQPLTGDGLHYDNFDLAGRSLNFVPGNSDSMTGTVAVGLFFVESNGAIDPNTYTWTATDETDTYNNVLTGLAWWSAQAPSYSSSVTFYIYNYASTNPITHQPYEPVTHSSLDDHLWINWIMSNAGYSSVVDFNTALKMSAGTNWSFSAFIAYNPPPAPGQFTNGRFAYAYFGGPYTQLLFTSMGYAGGTMTHETGHIFWACDEYYQAGYGGCTSCGACNPNGPRPNAQNANCEFCNTAAVSCIMRNTVHTLCDHTAPQIGWGPLIETELSNGIPYNDSISGASPQSTWEYYFVDVEYSQALAVELSNLTADADLYIAFDRKPTLFDYDCKSSRSGTTVERCTVGVPDGGRWWIGVNNFDTGTIQYTLLATMTYCINSLNVDPLPMLTGNVGSYMSQDATVSNGTAPYEFTIFFGSLPPGLSLYLGGWLTGVPTASGNFDFIIMAKDRFGCTGSRFFTMTIGACASNIQISPASLPSGYIGGPFTQTLNASGGSAPYTFSVTSGSLPPGVTLDSAGSFAGTPTTAGAYSFTVRAADAGGCFADRSYTINISAACLFCDEFDDDVLRADMNYAKGSWVEAGGSMTGSSMRKGLAIAMPAFAGCANCSVETTLKSAGGIGSRVWILGWYQDKSKYVELMMKADSGRWILKQRSGGKVIAKAKSIQTINVGTVYTAKIVFDGTNFEVYIDGMLAITMPAAAQPFGTAAFQLKSTTADFGYIRVN